MTPIEWACTNEEYHEDMKADSHSSLELFRESPRRYFKQRIEKSLPRRQPTPEMIIGSALHACVLEPEMFSKYYVCGLNGVDGRTKEGKAQKALFASQTEGKQVLEADSWRNVLGMAEALKNHSVASLYVTSQSEFTEHAFLWTDEESGRELKIKPDKFWTAGLLVNLKTASDPSPEGFRKAVSNFGYYRSSALHREGILQCFGIRARELFVVVGKEEPWDIGIYDLDAAALQLGHEDNVRTLRELTQCYITGDWSANWEKDVTMLSLPAWVYRSGGY